MSLGDWRGSVAQQTERVSGDGGSLVLVSQAQLTGYANARHRRCTCLVSRKACLGVCRVTRRGARMVKRC